MLVTLLGIVTDVMEVRPENAAYPMLVTLLGITVVLHPLIKVLDALSIIALQLSRESYVLFPLSTIIEVKLEQPTNAKPVMELTLLGMVTLVRPLQ